MTDIRSSGSTPEAATTPRGAAATGGVNVSTQSGQERQPTDSQQYMKKEEEELFDAIKERARRRKEDEALQKRLNPRKPFQLRPNQTIAALELSPDQKYVIAQVIESGTGSRPTSVPEYVTESGYTENIPGRTNVGDIQPKTRIAIIDSHSGEVKWLDHGLKAPTTAAHPSADKPEAKPAGGDGHPGSEGDSASSNATRESSGAAARQDETRGSGGAARPAQPPEREIRLSEPIWSEDGSKAVLMGRAADNKDRWIFALDPSSGKARVITTDHDDAWVDGPGSQTLGWMPGSQHIYFQSEKDGYSHLYTADYATGETRQLTLGKWEVTGVQLSNDKSHFFLTTSEASPGERHLYIMPASGGERVRLTSSPGNNQAILSPDEKWVALIYSYSNKPPELYVQENRPGALARQLTTSPSSEFWKYKWTDPPIVSFAARDGAKVYARVYKPASFKKGGPAVIFVHGAGYLQNVHRWWAAGYYREYMFHHFLMEHGYMVLDCDYRGSAGYGRDWRTGIYRHMGGKDLDDQVDAARWLVTEYGVDASRIGIYGGSYGGFITLMAMFTRPGVFAAGAALRPVTDWADYNHQYTANILNLPQSDAEAYKLSSPIFHADGLKGALLICHGMADTNVHFQDTVRLVQRLIELRKENWDLAVYPVENHGFTQSSSWADEYKRIFKLFEGNLKPSFDSGSSRAAK
jgi:dipeptidyl aminopeptidase/acylaminoacyl peptidase